jgi:hypothetical protein
VRVENTIRARGIDRVTDVIGVARSRHRSLAVSPDLS